MDRRSLVGALVALALVASASFASAAPRLQAEIRLEKAALDTSDEVVVGFGLRNAGDSSARVLRWQTPLHGVDADLFEVTRDGEPVLYTGRVFKRPAPTAADWLEVPAGQELTSAVNLSSVYDMARPGSYTIRFRVELLDPVGRPRAERALSGEVALTLTGEDRTPAPAEEPEEGVLDESGRYVTPTFTSCSTSRQSSLKTALGSAQTYAGNALSYLTAGKTGTRYTTWFGTYNSSRYSTVKTHFSKVDSAIRTKTVSFNCSCTDSAYAYVYPTQPYKIYLCSAFWSAPNTGTDSKAGTIIHEMTHFNVVASTDDYVYGQSGAKSLAKTSPTKAVDNADNHEYFAENNPALN